MHRLQRSKCGYVLLVEGYTWDNTVKAAVTFNSEDTAVYKYNCIHVQLVYVVLFIFGTAGNVICIIIIICNKDIRTIPVCTSFT
jgi:hypothetical protein